LFLIRKEKKFRNVTIYVLNRKKSIKRKRYRNPKFLTALGEHCRKIRIAKGYSIDRLSKEADLLSPASIHRLEQGQTDVQITVLYRIAETLDVDLKSLLDFESKYLHEE